MTRKYSTELGVIGVPSSFNWKLVSVPSNRGLIFSNSCIFLSNSNLLTPGVNTTSGDLVVSS